MNLQPFHICQAALNLIENDDFDKISMQDIANKTSLTEEDIYTWFGSKEDIITFLYHSINADWKTKVYEITHKKLADRFSKALLVKLDLVHPHSSVLSNILGKIIQDPKVGIYAPRTSFIRTIGMQNMLKIINGSVDGKKLLKKIPNLPKMLFMMHWLILFLHLQHKDKKKSVNLIARTAKLIKKGSLTSSILFMLPIIKELASWSEELFEEQKELNNSIDQEILKILFAKRKLLDQKNQSCSLNPCSECFAIHKDKLKYFTSQKKPIHFILPAFPAKSPNLQKVLGTKPDLGEEIALQNLQDLCQEIKSIYAPGAQITICSDGRIFAELVEITDQHISTYVEQLKNIIAEKELSHINIINLEDVLDGASFDDRRKKVIDKYATPLDELKKLLKKDDDFKQIFNGIHRFITEDRKVLFPEKSTSQIKEESKTIALQVIQHSNAWTRHLTYVFPEAVRLSIHPYSPHAEKIGIQLTKATNNWITPWHGTIVLLQNEYVLMKKEEAIVKEAKLITKNNNPHYYSLSHKT